MGRGKLSGGLIVARGRTKIKAGTHIVGHTMASGFLSLRGPRGGQWVKIP